MAVRTLATLLATQLVLTAFQYGTGAGDPVSRSVRPLGGFFVLFWLAIGLWLVLLVSPWRTEVARRERLLVAAILASFIAVIDVLGGLIANGTIPTATTLAGSVLAIVLATVAARAAARGPSEGRPTMVRQGEALAGIAALFVVGVGVCGVMASLAYGAWMRESTEDDRILYGAAYALMTLAILGAWTGVGTLLRARRAHPPWRLRWPAALVLLAVTGALTYVTGQVARTDLARGAERVTCPTSGFGPAPTRDDPEPVGRFACPGDRGASPWSGGFWALTGLSVVAATATGGLAVGGTPTARGEPARRRPTVRD